MVFENVSFTYSYDSGVSDRWYILILLGEYHKNETLRRLYTQFYVTPEDGLISWKLLQRL